MAKSDIFVTRSIAQSAVERLQNLDQITIWTEHKPPTYQQLAQMVKDCDGLLCLLTDRIDDRLIQGSPRLRVISTMSVGYEHIDLKACRRRGIQVGHTPDVLTDSTADFAVALILSVARRIPEAVEYARSGLWSTWDPGLLLGHDLSGITVGIVGMGRIGEAVARRIKAFGTNLVYHDPLRRTEIELELDAKSVTFDELLTEADITTLHVPLTKQTHHLISYPQLKLMKPTALLINTSRGKVVDTEALLHALQNGEIQAAGLDVTDPEPLPADHPLFKLPNCLITPHIASAGAATRTKMAHMAVDNLLAGLQGGPLPYPVA
jgi:glyoxylate reductase